TQTDCQRERDIRPGSQPSAKAI
ncbi:hypothetical protein, partial [Bacillus sp. JJ675]